MVYDVKVRYGKPILKLSITTLKYIAIALVITAFLIILHGFYLLYFALFIKTHVGDFVSMVNNDGWILPIGAAFPGLLCIVVAAFSLFIISSAFKGTEAKRKGLNVLMFVYVLVCFTAMLLIFTISIILLTHAYSAHVGLHDGITEAMNKYRADTQYKKNIDILQFEFQCCGSHLYKEWFSIVWFDENLVDNRWVWRQYIYN